MELISLGQLLLTRYDSASWGTFDNDWGQFWLSQYGVSGGATGI